MDDGLSWASTKSVMARRSAEPPGLSRRATKLSWTDRARSRQPGLPTPPASRKCRAARRAKRRPSRPPRCRRLVSSTDSDEREAGFDARGFRVVGSQRSAARRRAGKPTSIDAGKSLRRLACAHRRRRSGGGPLLPWLCSKHRTVEYAATPEPRDDIAQRQCGIDRPAGPARRRQRTAGRGRIWRRDAC